MGPQKAPGEARALVSSCSGLLPTPKITQAVARSIDQEPTAVHVISKAKGASPKLASACRGWQGGAVALFSTCFPRGQRAVWIHLPSLQKRRVRGPRQASARLWGRGCGSPGPPHICPPLLFWSVSSALSVHPLLGPSLIPSRGSAIPLRACHSQPSTWPKQRPPSTPPALPSSDLPFGPLSRALPTSTQLCVTALAPVAHTRRWPRPE